MPLLSKDTTATKVTLKNLLNTQLSLNGVITLKAGETKEVDLGVMAPPIRRRAWNAIENANGKSIEMTLSTGSILPRHVAKTPTAQGPRILNGRNPVPGATPAVVAGPAVPVKVDGPALTIKPEKPMQESIKPVKPGDIKHVPVDSFPEKTAEAAAAKAAAAAPAGVAAPVSTPAVVTNPVAPVIETAPAVVTDPVAPVVETAPAVVAPAAAPVVETAPAVVAPAAVEVGTGIVNAPAAETVVLPKTAPAAAVVPPAQA